VFECLHRLASALLSGLLCARGRHRRKLKKKKKKKKKKPKKKKKYDSHNAVTTNAIAVFRSCAPRRNQSDRYRRFISPWHEHWIRRAASKFVHDLLRVRSPVFSVSAFAAC
jgi:hypothetical protein